MTEQKRFEVYNDDNFEEIEMEAYIGSEEQWKEYITNRPHTYITFGKVRHENGIEIHEVWIGNEVA